MASFASVARAPSVDLMQPWRLIRISDTDYADLRELSRNVSERQPRSRSVNERDELSHALERAGCTSNAMKFWSPRSTVAASTPPDAHCPMMDLTSVACAIQNPRLENAP